MIAIILFKYVGKDYIDDEDYELAHPLTYTIKEICNFPEVLDISSEDSGYAIKVVVDNDEQLEILKDIVTKQSDNDIALNMYDWMEEHGIAFEHLGIDLTEDF